MNGWAVACLAVMAVALVVMAAGQLIMAIVVAKLARQTIETVQDIRRDVQPVIGVVQQVAENVSKATALAVVQVERVDQVMAATAQRLDDTVAMVQDTILGPLRQGSAVIAGLRAGLEFFRGASERRRRRSRRDDDDALFIG